MMEDNQTATVTLNLDNISKRNEQIKALMMDDDPEGEYPN